MGITWLEKQFDLRILDCTSWLLPEALKTRENGKVIHPAVRNVASRKELALQLDQPGYAIDYVGQFSLAAVALFDTLRKLQIRIIVIDNVGFPIPIHRTVDKAWTTKLWSALKYGQITTHINAGLVKAFLRLLPNQDPDIAIVSGSAWQDNPRFFRAKRQVHAHSFDYERFRNISRNLEFKDLPSTLSNYAIYLDEDLTGHEDNIELGLSMPATEAHFFPALNRMFDFFENEQGIKIVVAGYPSRVGANANRFNGRQVIWGATAELIRNSRFVFAHASTAISFAVLWRRPIIFLTSEEISLSWYAPWIEAARNFLAAPIINIDSLPRQRSYENINEQRYLEYEEKFIKAANSPDRSLWEILTDALDQNEVEN